jgi:hypothetical protein
VTRVLTKKKKKAGPPGYLEGGELATSRRAAEQVKGRLFQFQHDAVSL